MSRPIGIVLVKMSAITAALTLALIGTLVQGEAAATFLNWVQINTTQAPAGRQFAAMSYDSRRSRIVLFGGSVAYPSAFSDTWEWDGATWIHRTSALSPPGLLGAAIAYDPGRGRSVLFGGATSAGATTAGTWEWDGSAWVQKSPVVSPPARVFSAMAYDSARHRVIMFGGNGSGSDLADTWQFDGTTWTQLFPTTSPAARFGAAMAFDSVRGRIVLFGGRGSGLRLGDTWEWNGTSWTQRSSSSAPYARFWHSMVFDSKRGRTILFGGDFVRPYALGPINDTWQWNGIQWTQDWTSAAPSPRAGHSMAYDVAVGRSVLFGGTNEVAPQSFYNDTWELGAGIVTPPGNPAVTFSPSSAEFGSAKVGSTSQPVHVTLASSGTGPLLISSISTTGDFSVSSTDCPTKPNPLAAGTYCFVFVTFTPKAIGDRFGNLVVSDNGPGGSRSVPLHGTGT